MLVALHGHGVDVHGAKVRATQHTLFCALHVKYPQVNESHPEVLVKGLHRQTLMERAKGKRQQKLDVYANVGHECVRVRVSERVSE